MHTDISRSIKAGKRIITRITLLLFCLFTVAQVNAQDQTIIRGRVLDAKTKQPLPFVDVVLKGTYVGVSTDLDGQYFIQTRNPSDTIQVSFIGYKTLEERIIRETRQEMNFYMEEEGLQLESVTIVAEKGRYRKKGNPAVELIDRKSVV